MEQKIHMVDLISQYKDIKSEVDIAINKVIEEASFIKGPQVKEFESSLSDYLNCGHTIACANGTDALQIALMALGLKPGDEVIVPAFTYVATAEVIALLGLKPVMVDVELDSFSILLDGLEKAVTTKTKAIVPVHLFGQSSNMEAIMKFASTHNLYVVEDNAQAIGSDFIFESGERSKTGTIGHIGCTSFFPSKNLGCYGDGGAIFTNDDHLATQIRMIANHGQKKKYYHSVVGCNSRLDSIQAAVLNIKLKKLDEYCAHRNKLADYYDGQLSDIEELIIPYRYKQSTHVFHQYTLRVANGKRDALKEHLSANNIPCGIYYPLPLYKQEAYSHYVTQNFSLSNTEQLCEEVISLPMHTHMTEGQREYIVAEVRSFFDD